MSVVFYKYATSILLPTSRHWL